MKYILRPAISVIVAILLIDALFLIVHGVKMTFGSYWTYIMEPEAERPLLNALEAVDLFFLALAFFIVAIGLVQLFIGEVPMLKSVSFSWLQIKDFTDLKLLLWYSFLVTILVLFMTQLMRVEDPDWKLLILPISILLLSAGAYLVKKH